MRKKACKAGYTVFDWNGKVVYSMTAKKSVAQVAKEVINGEWGTDRIDETVWNPLATITQKYRKSQ